MHAIKRILAPVDFSEGSRDALAYGLRLAEHFGASLDVFHAWSAPAYVSPYLAVQINSNRDAPDTLETIARSEADRKMKAFMAEQRIPVGVQVSLRVEFGIESEIIALATEDYDLVVMGTHGRTGLSHFFLGSVAEKTVRAAKVPVITVRATPHARPVPLRRILVPTDFSAGSREALEHALAIAKSFGARVDLLHTWQLPPHLELLEIKSDAALSVGRVEAETSAEVSKIMDEFAKDVVPPQGVELNTWVQRGDAAEKIIEASARYDMIVMSTHGRSGLSRVVLGSVATKVVRRSEAPVFIVKMSPGALAAASEKPARPPETKTAHALFTDPTKLGTAYRELLSAGLKMEDLSIIMTESAYRDATAIMKRTHAKEGGTAGTMLGAGVGGVLGLLTVLGAGVGASAALLVLGPAVALAAAGGLLGGLVGWGVPSDVAERVEKSIHEGAALLTVHAPGDAVFDLSVEILRKNDGDLITIERS